MIDLLRREPIVKRISIYMGIGLITILFIFSINQYNNFKNIYLEQLNINKKIVGSIVSEHPELEADIVNSIYINDKDYSDLGEKVLKKYGYDKNYKMIENINFQQHIKYFLVNNLIVFVGIIILIILIMCNLMKYVFNKLDKVSKNIECIIHGKYNIKDDFKEEGIFNIIHSDLNKLSKSINTKIKNLDKEKENIKELVTDISHQLKTPLASLKLYNSLLLEEDLEEEDRKEFLKTSGMYINKLQSLIESLVNISRLETSMISIKKENKNIKATIIKAIESVKPKAINKFISINLNDFDDKIVPHDSKWTEECIFNILDNAVKYTNLKGKIDIYVQDAINFIRIDIKDNGIGIDKNEFNNIFKRFYRSEEVQDLEGSGVGLYLSRKILESQGGNIIVSSQKGEGSKFSLFLTKV
ncbi:his Kinase A domain protein [[Clostridium] bifermentans ATCC 638]|uniref:histidine kinase n=1 Tax=Paraclostridium bifermentans ATCC 638 = DSM 14991 TaxID=1233171 RepID=T4VDP7_PARBF|nr:HAMP domain-containing sensor histidine kinase [Paraclostridium bifermentans]EQK41859.1 his Kinase A domain protein [[Clostridium] bifermentans ATCC 638] [Paraclostridium bifermentans ATCC 638 = DSM 14991]RIZ59182.1 sensor histidine kinase [Paraclostridium bifermentans]UAG18736.1 HAMP domain-containing histidine kinase [Paraclostridium bifermentans]